LGRVVGFRFRRSVKVLPGIRLNLSKSGASVSLGARGAHYTIGPKGTRTTIGLPGTGLFWTEYRPHGGHSSARDANPNSQVTYRSPPTPQISPIANRFETEPAVTPIESRTGNEINSLSTSQLAPVLNRAHRRFRLAIPMLIGSLCLFIFAIDSGIQGLVGISALYFSIFVPISIFLDRYRRSVRISLKLNRTAETISEVLSEAFSELKGCESIWSISAQAYTNDWKRNAGATTLNQRDRTWLQFSRPNCVRGKIIVPTIKLGSAILYFFPDSILVISKKSVAALHYRDLEFSHSVTAFIENSRVPRDALVVGQTWRFVNKSGGPDRRFNFNKQLPICRYGEMDFGSSGGLNGRVQFSNIAAGDKFAKAIGILIKHAASSSELNPIASYSDAKNWPSIVFLSCALLIGAAIVSAGVLMSPGTFFGASNTTGQSRSQNSIIVTSQKGSALNSTGKVQPSERQVQGNSPSVGRPLDISPVSSAPAPYYPATQSFPPIPPQVRHPFSGQR
jgi:hypothetical protein